MADTTLGSGGSLVRVVSTQPDSHPPRDQKDQRKKKSEQEDPEPRSDGEADDSGARQGPILNVDTARVRATELEARFDREFPVSDRRQLKAIEELLSIFHLLVGMLAARRETEECADAARRAERIAARAPEATNNARDAIGKLTGEGEVRDRAFADLWGTVRSVSLKARAVGAEAARAAHSADNPIVATELESSAKDLSEIAAAVDASVRRRGPVSTYGRNGVVTTLPEPEAGGPHVISTKA